VNNSTNHISLPKGWIEYPSDCLIIRGARLFDPSIGLDEVSDLVIRDGDIKSIGAKTHVGTDSSSPQNTIDASEWIVCPGLFDMHVHLREPGYEYKETIQSGCIAAAVGGFTGVAPMPNTNPVTDNPGVVNLIRKRAVGLPVDVHPIAAVTLSRKGETLTELAELHESGVTGFSDDGSPVSTAVLMRLALEYIQMFDGVIIEHCEEPSLTAKGVMDEGAMSTALGLPGWPSVAEDLDIYRSIRLAEYTGGRIHIAHTSTAEGVRLIREAKARGVKVTAEAMPHHLTLDSSVLETYNSDFKVNPPLRTKKDVEALIEGVADGTIDVIATDHAPHAPDEKEVEFINAPFGMIGLETALGVILTKLVKTNKITLERAIDALAIQPRQILRLPEASIKVGNPANLTLFNFDIKWKVDRNQMLSKAKNTPFHGWELTGQACGVINCGVAWVRK